MAGGVAHDFNILLTVITGFSQLTLDNLPLLHPLRTGVEEVMKAAALASSITRQLLAFSRGQPSCTENIALNELVAGAQRMLERLIGADVNFALRLDPTAGDIRVDVGHIEQVIMNLVVNAKDAMPNGGQLVIETAHQTIDESHADSYQDLAPGRYAALMVSDTGTGISPELEAHIFEPFFTTKEPGKGTGLGLSTVYGIVKQYGGSISVQSELGRGTKFTILFPALDAQHSHAAARPAVSMPLATETILLAEDEEGMRILVRLILEGNGHRVLECSNGREAIECARQCPDPIHLLLTDAAMPEMGGAELAAQFGICCLGVPVLCMYGYSGMVWPGVATEENWLQKPFNPAMLVTRVRALLDNNVK